MIKPVRTPRCICGADAPGVTVRSVMRQELSQNMNDVTSHTNINETTGRPEDRKGGKKPKKAEKVYSPKEEKLNIATHIFGAAVCGVFGVLMIIKSCIGVAGGEYGASAIVGTAIFTFSLLVTYIMSAIYHSCKPGTTARAVMRRFDHCSIALLIAGSYLVYSIVGLINRGTDQPADTVWGIVIASVEGVLAIVIIALNGVSVEKFKIFTLIAYIVMGWMIIFRVYHLVLALPTSAFVLLLLGGIAYTAGVPFYKIDKIPYNHAIWHLFVLAGSVLMICSVLFCLL